jgi:hypothetical protein
VSLHTSSAEGQQAARYIGGSVEASSSSAHLTLLSTTNTDMSGVASRLALLQYQQLTRFIVVSILSQMRETVRCA